MCLFAWPIHDLRNGKVKLESAPNIGLVFFVLVLIFP